MGWVAYPSHRKQVSHVAKGEVVNFLIKKDVNSCDDYITYLTEPLLCTRQSNCVLFLRIFFFPGMGLSLRYKLKEILFCSFLYFYN